MADQVALGGDAGRLALGATTGISGGMTIRFLVIRSRACKCWYPDFPDFAAAACVVFQILP
ncbi:hypothetical protein ACFQU2_31190 [Siccirubricoccus deserti]